jgi:hypothetical protein
MSAAGAYALDTLQQTTHALSRPARGTENRGPGHQDIRPGSHGPGRGGRIDPAIDLDLDLQTTLVDQAP